MIFSDITGGFFLVFFHNKIKLILGRFLHYFSADLHNFPQNIASKRKSFSTKVFPKAGENPEKQGKIKAFQQ
jgi:hypothetical protein